MDIMPGFGGMYERDRIHSSIPDRQINGGKTHDANGRKINSCVACNLIFAKPIEKYNYCPRCGAPVKKEVGSGT